ncbi:MAG: butyrate kinase [Bacillota bacterium]|nr:butyrate kinase [Bacillota bacterium]
MTNKILVINPGSTTTKLAVYLDEKPIFETNIRHESGKLKELGSISGQLEYRRQLVADTLNQNGFELKEFTAIACRGGLIKQMPSGTYRITPSIVHDSEVGVSGQHASNLGALIGHELELETGIPAYIVDPPVVNELSPRAKYSGHPAIERRCVFHALNQKAVARQYAADHGCRYEDLNLLVCHMGGGVSVGAHVKGKVVDTEDAVSGEGPFSPERAGSMPVNGVISLCFSGKYTETEVRDLMTRGSGLLAYTGSNNMRQILAAAESGDEIAVNALDAFYYQVAKEIAAMSVAMNGQVDQIILTGGIANSQVVTGAISAMVDWIAPVSVYPGEDEMLALAKGVLRVLRGEEEAGDYDKVTCSHHL